MPKPTKDALVSVAVFIGILALLFVTLRFFGSDTVRQTIESAGIWAPIFVIIAKASTIVFAPISGTLLYPLAGVLFGFWKGLALVVLGDALGAGIAFWISRTFGRRIVARFLGGNDNILADIIGTMGTVRGFFVTRLLLITMPDPIAYAAGLTRLPFLPFILIHSAIGVIPSSILLGLGATLLEDASAGKFALIFAAASLFGVFSMLAYVYFFAGKKELPSSEGSSPNTSPETH